MSMNRHTLLNLALVLSLGVNLLTAGVVLGNWRDRERRPPPMAWAAAPLKPEMQGLVRQRMRSQASQFRPLRRDMRRALQAVRRVAAAQPYDASAMSLALERMRDVTMRYQQLIHINVVEMGAELPPQERLALLRAALQGLPAGRPRPAPAR